MDPPTASLDSSNPPDMDATSASLATTFDSPVAAHLAPTNIPLSKVQRAWDRRPQSPFSRKQVRFGKVWKRNPAPAAGTTGLFGAARGWEAIGQDSPAKAVKKMRVEYGEVVRDWDGRGSPGNRRIVTRSNRDEELLALDEEEPQEQDVQEVEEEVLRVEIVGEDGVVQEVDAEEELQQDEWEDESVAEEDAWDATLMHLGEAAEHAVVAPHGETDAADNDEPMPVESTLHQDEADEATAPEETIEAEQGKAESAAVPTELESSITPAMLSKPSFEAPILPEGFVSPVKERRRRPISKVKQAQANRRRTLPVNFSTEQTPSIRPTLKADTEETVVHAEDGEAADPEAIPVEHTISDNEVASEEVSADANTTAKSMTEPTQESDVVPNENEWEDVEEEDNAANGAFRDMTPEPVEQPEWVDTVENTPTTPAAEGPSLGQPLAAQVHDRVAELVSPSKLPSSPVPSITGQHPRLPLRRSPRRQSTSPMKRSNKLSHLQEKSHLIAFTPVKLSVFQSTTPEPRLASSPLPTSPALLQSVASPAMGFPQPTRSSSAPPEEPQMSPRKPGQPRLSDDTALLQAFINRASESKNGRRVSATARRESLENRRNSDVVRQALASPAVKPVVNDVLGDLDPNSPSPRKQTSTEPDVKHPKQEDHSELTQPSPAKTVSRRSGRAKKKPDTLPATTYSGPNKISIRGTADSVVLKKTDAQELAQATRTNTRKNKGTAVLPPLRLTRMAKEAALEGGEETVAVPMEIENANRRGIKWAETLATFHEGADEPEISMMIDELSGPEPGNANAEVEINGMSVPTPASDTPSKPRQRRLKPTRTASAPAKTAQPAPVENEAETSESKPKPVTKKRSRIATPAKPRGNAKTVETQVEEAKKAPAAKKKAVSKLPAPSTSAIPAAQGKENSLIASPPKKRARAPDSGLEPVAKSLQPKLDFSKSIGLEQKQAESGNGPLPGIASPAKRSARTNVLFGEDGSVTEKELPPSLGSPAKKRTRRTPG